MVLGQFLKEGFLGRKKKMKSKLFFTLDSLSLTGYKKKPEVNWSQKEFQKNRKEVIDLTVRGTSVQIHNQAEFSFSLKTSTTEEVFFVAAQAELEEWVAAIQKAFDQIQRALSEKEKRGVLKLNGHTQFVILKGKFILWQKSEHSEKIDGYSPLEGATVNAVDNYCVISTKNGGEVKLEGPTEQVQDWAQAITEFINAKVHRVLPDTFQVIYTFPNGDYLAEEANLSMTPEQVKAKVLPRLKEEAKIDAGVDAFLLQCYGMSYYFTDEFTPLGQTELQKLIRETAGSTPPALVLVPKADLLSKGINLSTLITTNKTAIDSAAFKNFEDLIAKFTVQNVDLTDPEVYFARRSFASERVAMRARNEINAVLPLASISPLPYAVWSKAKDTSYKLMVTVDLNHAGKLVRNTFPLPLNNSADEFTAIVLERLQKVGQVPVGNMKLKVHGLRSYLYGATPLHDFEIVREAMENQSNLHFSTVFHQAQKQVGAELDLLTSAPPFRVSPTQLKESSISDDSLLRVRIVSIAQLTPPYLVDDENQVGIEYYLEISIHHGLVQLENTLTSISKSLVSFSGTISFNQWLASNKHTGNLPAETRLSIAVFAKPHDGGNYLSLRKQMLHLKDKDLEKRDTTPIPVGWANVQLFDFAGKLRSGTFTIGLWPGESNPSGSTASNLDGLQLTLQFDKQAKAQFFQQLPLLPAKPVLELSQNVWQVLDEITQCDALYEPTEEEKSLLWSCRHALKKKSQALSKLLLCVDWADPRQVAEMHSMLGQWAALSPSQALQLLDVKFGSRQFAVNSLESLPDEDLHDFLLELTQAIKHEPLHDSALARFLLKRAYGNPDHIGHPFFWFMRSELHNPLYTQRFSLLCEAYLRALPNALIIDLLHQVELNARMSQAAYEVQTNSKDDMKQVFEYCIRKVQTGFPDRQLTPLFSEIEVSGLIVSKCRFMKSKKKPLWLVFENVDADAKPCVTMFKGGDDLRQDALTLQLLRLMDKLWKRAGMDLLLSPYRVIVTGDQLGMLEVVLNAETTASINREEGGAVSVLSKDVLTKWLRENNNSDELFKEAQRKFALSTAGYCVATYVLGIGDRHNDNIMMTKDGKLFHIDFGHFLGHYKKKFGIEREKAPFVFSPQYAHVLGGSGADAYKLFQTTACAAYNVIRQNADLFVGLLSMMLGVGLPELATHGDVAWLRKTLHLHLTEEQAADKFLELIEISVNTKTTQVMDIVHIIAN